MGGGGGGNVVFVSSGAATGNTAGWGCYNATKVRSLSPSSSRGRCRIPSWRFQFIGGRILTDRLHIRVVLQAALNSLCRTYANEERSIASFAVRPGMVDVSPLYHFSPPLSFVHDGA